MTAFDSWLRSVYLCLCVCVCVCAVPSVHTASPTLPGSALPAHPALCVPSIPGQPSRGSQEAPAAARAEKSPNSLCYWGCKNPYAALLQYCFMFSPFRCAVGFPLSKLLPCEKKSHYQQPAQISHQRCLRCAVHTFLGKELASITGNGKLGLACEVFLLVQLSVDFLKIRK